MRRASGVRVTPRRSARRWCSSLMMGKANRCWRACAATSSRDSHLLLLTPTTRTPRGPYASSRSWRWPAKWFAYGHTVDRNTTTTTLCSPLAAARETGRPSSDAASKGGTGFPIRSGLVASPAEALPARSRASRTAAQPRGRMSVILGGGPGADVGMARGLAPLGDLGRREAVSHVDAESGHVHFAADVGAGVTVHGDVDGAGERIGGRPSEAEVVAARELVVVDDVRVHREIDGHAPPAVRLLPISDHPHGEGRGHEEADV